MTAQLPAPLSLWRNRTSGKVLQVFESTPQSVLLHNCGDPNAIVSLEPFALVSWRGTPEQFTVEFEPA